MPITKTKISFKMDLEEKLKDIKPSERKKASEVVGLYLIDQIQEHVSDTTSPVKSGNYKPTLSEEYREFKKSKGKGTKADLQFSGGMMGNLSLDATKKDITLKITKTNEKKKAFNHIKGDTLPQRQFLPDDSENETFNKEIIKGVDSILKEFKK